MPHIIFVQHDGTKVRVAEMLGYSDQVTQKHAAEAGNTWARYVQR